MIIDEDQIIKNLLPGSHIDDAGIVITGQEGYWSNLSREENTELIKKINEKGPRVAIQSEIPHLLDMIYSPKREAALELLDVEAGKICIDYGCMWGVLSSGAARRGLQVIAIDQTYESLYFLKKRCEKENIENISCVQGDIKNLNFKNIADYAIVNGVLEWIPVNESVEVDKYHKGNISSAKKELNPMIMQADFLNHVKESLLPGGKLVLAIENRHSYQYYMGMKDPHANLLYTTFLPRYISNFISRIFRHRPYRNYIYSFKKIKKMLLDSGFSEVKLYAAFPNYHFPELILDYSSGGFKHYQRYPNKLRITPKQKIAYAVEIVLMKLFRKFEVKNVTQ